MSHNKNHDSQQLPVGRLGIISPYSCAELGTKVDNYLVSWRKKRHNEGVLYEGYDRDTYLIGSDLPRFGSGEAKGILKESVRGDDIYILVDVCNYSLTYSLAGQTNHMSPDDHYQNLKRIIAAHPQWHDIGCFKTDVKGPFDLKVHSVTPNGKQYGNAAKQQAKQLLAQSFHNSSCENRCNLLHLPLPAQDNDVFFGANL